MAGVASGEDGRRSIRRPVMSICLLMVVIVFFFDLLIGLPTGFYSHPPLVLSTRFLASQKQQNSQGRHLERLTKNDSSQTETRNSTLRRDSEADTRNPSLQRESEKNNLQVQSRARTQNRHNPSLQDGEEIQKDQLEAESLNLSESQNELNPDESQDESESQNLEAGSQDEGKEMRRELSVEAESQKDREKASQDESESEFQTELSAETESQHSSSEADSQNSNKPLLQELLYPAIHKNSTVNESQEMTSSTAPPSTTEAVFVQTHQLSSKVSSSSNKSSSQEKAPQSGIRNRTSDKMSAILPPLKSNYTDGKYVRPGFAVWSPSCQIPDLDPWHPTIRRMVSSTPPIDCSSDSPVLSETRQVRDPLTSLLRTALRINPELMQRVIRNGSRDVECCYQNLIRKDDQNVEYSQNCRSLDIYGSSVLLSGQSEEFVRVQCRKSSSKKPFFTYFHTSAPDRKLPSKRKNRTSTGRAGYSLLIVGVDSMSRLNAHRQLPLTMKLLLQEMDSVEMKGFVKIGDNTFPNLVALLTGTTEKALEKLCWANSSCPLDDCPWLWKRYSESGYKTLYGEDCAWMSTFNYVKKGFTDPPTDFYARPYMSQFDKQLGRRWEGNCNLCLGSTSHVQATLGWAKQVLSKDNSPFFGLCWTNSLSHDYLNTASAGDLLYRDFFRDLRDGGHLDRTVVIFMGDHGIRWGEIVTTYVGRMEERMPLLAIHIPKVLEEEHPDWASNLRFNSHRLVTPFDLHSTFLDLLPPGKSSLPLPASPGLSLFSRIPTDRDCDEAGISMQWCTCQHFKALPNDNAEAAHVTLYVIDHLTRLLASSPACADLKLDAILSARLRAPLKSLKSDARVQDVFDYGVTFRTKPGGAVLDATVRFVPKKHTHELLGEVARLNLYGTQSWCVQDSKLRKYCYCKKQIGDNAS